MKDKILPIIIAGLLIGGISYAIWGDTAGKIGLVIGVILSVIGTIMSDKEKNSSSDSTSTIDIVVGGDDVAQQGDWIYHSVTGNDGYLCKMNINDGTVVQLNSDNCVNIAVSGDWVYYENRNNDKNELCKIRTNGSSKVTINSYDEFYHCINVVGDYIYYLNDVVGGNICRIGTDGSNRKKLLNDEVSYIKVIGDWIYYHDSENDCICRVRTNGTNKNEMIYYLIGSEEVETVEEIFILNDWIYYRSDDVNGNIFKARIDASGVRTKVNNDDSSNIIVVGNWIYYKNEDDGNSLYKIQTDGGNRAKLCNDELLSFSVIDKWIYYRSENDISKLCKMSLDGSQKQFVK